MVCKLNNAFPASIATRFARCGSRPVSGEVGVGGWSGEVDLGLRGSRLVGRRPEKIGYKLL